MILPVLDIMAGRVVRGIAGRRHEYRPLEPECDPLAVARFFRDRFLLTTLYLADLDAIAGQSAAASIYEALTREGFSLWIDAGIRRAMDVADVVRSGAEKVVVGLETLEGPDVLDVVVCEWSASRIVFSLDLKGGTPLALPSWQNAEPLEIIERAISAGVGSLLVLDLSRVGVNAGIGTEELCQRVRQRWPKIEIIAGGGVRGADDLRRLASIGIDHVLVASALHDGRLTRDDIRS